MSAVHFKGKSQSPSETSVGFLSFVRRLLEVNVYANRAMYSVPLERGTVPTMYSDPLLGRRAMNVIRGKG